MENYIVSARKYRPQTFESVVGQQALTQTLQNAIRQDRLAHAYLFCGPRGVGKTTCARIFAKTINCLNPQNGHDACNECESCRAFNEQRSFNIHELDAASNNSVEDIRQLIDQVRIPPQIGKYSVYIIDEVHMLSAGAFNALLKTLEEPPSYAIFILATTEKHKVLPTILSRCQVYDFNRITVPDTIAYLQKVAANEGIKVSEHHKLTPSDLQRKHFLNGLVVSHQAILVRRLIAGNYNTDYRISADYDWCVRAVTASRRNAYLDEYLCKFLTAGVSQKQRKRSWAERFHIMRTHFGLLRTLWAHFLIVLKYPFSIKY